ncbi:hypothetical protein [Helicobacter typhlonius]|uniref:hypothetical protein n=1 Tax=Helicobacter typhlonius TaxID=76936 RepID=UPI002FE08138
MKMLSIKKLLIGLVVALGLLISALVNTETFDEIPSNIPTTRTSFDFALDF